MQNPKTNADELAAKKSMRVKWADHFGGGLSAARIMESSESAAAVADTETTVIDSHDSISDTKKRDRLREKELLANMK